METRKLFIGVGAIMMVAALVAVSVTLGLLASGGSDSDGEIVSAAPSNQQADSGARRPAGRVLQTVIDDGNGPVASTIEILPSPDLPGTESETSGVFLRRVDNSVFVGTGSIELNVQIEQAADGSIVPSVSLSSNGPEVEVVITRDTVLYQDVTEIPGQGGVPGKAGDTTVTQQVKLIDSLDDLNGNAELQVWGTRRADRVVADILVFGIVDPNLGF